MQLTKFVLLFDLTEKIDIGKLRIESNSEIILLGGI